jgi:hypothetical protein
MYISENDREIEFVLVSVPDREEDIVSSLRQAIASGFVGNLFYYHELILYIKKLNRRTIGILNDIHRNSIRTYHAYLVVCMN